jgi:proton-dependent oligopeptide transporter, POT family
MATAANPSSKDDFLGHPKGLYLLFTAEMWERMSYYGMRALLVLYMTKLTSEGGFGWSKSTALTIYGWYTGLVYLTPVFGGFLADRFLGQRRAVLLGGSLMVAGHFLMAVPGHVAFFAALSLLVFGNGFFKPNISTQVGQLYSADDARRDRAFTIFYMGINTGALIAPLICGSLGEKVGFHYGFGAAGVGMTLGLIAYGIGAPRFLKGIGEVPSTKQDRAGGADAEPVVALTSDEVDRIRVIFILAVFTMIFWAAFEQAGGLMTLYTDEKVDRHLFGFEIPTSWFQSVNPIFIVVLGPVAATMWRLLAERGKEPNTPVKMAMGLVIMGSGFLPMVLASIQSANGAKASLFLVVAAYVLHTLGELCLSPVGLSMVTKLAPIRLGSLMMGVWFGANFFANLAAGQIGGFSEKLGERSLFTGIFAASALAGLVLFLISKPLVRWMHGRG